MVASAILDVFRGMLPEAVPRLNAIAIDGWALVFVAVLSLLTGLTFGLAPAWRTAAVNLHTGLKSAGARGSGDSESGRLRGLLVVTEVALALVLLMGAGLLLKSFVTLRTRPLGFTPDRVVIANVTLPEASYSTAARLDTYFREALAGVQSDPDLEAAGLVSALPLARTGGASAATSRPKARPPSERASWFTRSPLAETTSAPWESGSSAAVCSMYMTMPMRPACS